MSEQQAQRPPEDIPGIDKAQDKSELAPRSPLDGIVTGVIDGDKFKDSAKRFPNDSATLVLRSKDASGETAKDVEISLLRRENGDSRVTLSVEAESRDYFTQDGTVYMLDHEAGHIMRNDLVASEDKVEASPDDLIDLYQRLQDESLKVEGGWASYNVRPQPNLAEISQPVQ